MNINRFKFVGGDFSDNSGKLIGFDKNSVVIKKRVLNDRFMDFDRIRKDPIKNMNFEDLINLLEYEDEVERFYVRTGKVIGNKFNVEAELIANKKKSMWKKIVERFDEEKNDHVVLLDYFVSYDIKLKWFGMKEEKDIELYPKRMFRVENSLFFYSLEDFMVEYMFLKKKKNSGWNFFYYQNGIFVNVGTIMINFDTGNELIERVGDVVSSYHLSNTYGIDFSKGEMFNNFVMWNDDLVVFRLNFFEDDFFEVESRAKVYGFDFVNVFLIENGKKKEIGEDEAKEVRKKIEKRYKVFNNEKRVYLFKGMKFKHVFNNVIMNFMNDIKCLYMDHESAKYLTRQEWSESTFSGGVFDYRGMSNIIFKKYGDMKIFLVIMVSIALYTFLIESEKKIVGEVWETYRKMLSYFLILTVIDYGMFKAIFKNVHFYNFTSLVLDAYILLDLYLILENILEIVSKTMGLRDKWGALNSSHILSLVEKLKKYTVKRSDDSILSIEEGAIETIGKAIDKLNDSEMPRRLDSLVMFIFVSGFLRNDGLGNRVRQKTYIDIKLNVLCIMMFVCSVVYGHIIGCVVSIIVMKKIYDDVKIEEGEEVTVGKVIRKLYNELGMIFIGRKLSKKMRIFILQFLLLSITYNLL